MLLRELFNIITYNAFPADINVLAVVVQLLLTGYTTARTIFCVLKRDNVGETVVLLMFPGIFLFTAMLAQLMIGSSFIACPKFNTMRICTILRMPVYGRQLMLIAVTYIAAAATYAWIDRRLNGSRIDAALVGILCGVEGISAAISLAVGLGAMMGMNAWLKQVPPALMKWYTYGLWVLLFKEALYAFSVVYALLFANQRARRILLGRESSAPGGKGAGKSIAGEAYADYGPGDVEEVPVEAHKRVKAYIRGKYAPYFCGLTMYLALVAVWGLMSYYEARTTGEGIGATMQVVGFVAFMLIFVFQYPAAVLGVFRPGSTRLYKGFLKAQNPEKRMELFCREFFGKAPLHSVGKKSNLVLTEHFLVVQGLRPQIIYLGDVASTETLGARWNMTCAFQILYRDGKSQKLDIAADKDGLMRWMIQKQLGEIADVAPRRT